MAFVCSALFELPERGPSGCLRRATPAEAEALLCFSLDKGLMRQMGHFARSRCQGCLP